MKMLKMLVCRALLLCTLFPCISLVCYGGEKIEIGMFCLEPCQWDTTEYSISINKRIKIENLNDTLHIPSEIQNDGKMYRVIKIANNGFRTCCSIKNLVIDEGIREIGVFAFKGCTALHSVKFPSTMRILGECAFYNCAQLKYIQVDKDNKLFDSREDCNAVICTPNNAVILGCAGTTFPKSVTEISKSAFWGCIGLVTIKIPKWINSVGDEAFADCFNLKEINLPEDGTVNFGLSAFDGCTSLTSLYIPSGNFSFFYNPFTNCENLSTFIVSTKNKDWRTDKDGTVLIYNDGNVLFAGGMNAKICEDIKEIHSMAFQGCRKLTKVFIPASVETIGEGGFMGCQNLVSVVVDKRNKIYDSREDCNCIIETQLNKIICGSSVATIPQSVSVIGKYAFYGMNTSAVFRIPDNITKIEDSAFANCKNLFQLMVPANTELKYNSFCNCSRLSNVIYESRNKYIRTKKDINFLTSPFLGCSNSLSISIDGEIVPKAEYGFFGEE